MWALKAAPSKFAKFAGVKPAPEVYDLGLTKPKMEPRHLDLFDVETIANDVSLLHYKRKRMLGRAKAVLNDDRSRLPYEPDIKIPRDVMLKAVEESINGIEDELVVKLCEMRDLIFEALGKLDYRPPIEAEA